MPLPYRPLVLALALAACGQPGATTSTSSGPAPDAAALAAKEAAQQAEIAAALARLPAPYNSADYDNGRKVFQQCGACHLIAAGAGHSVGPNLHGVLGRKAGSLTDFNYSDSLKKSDIVWSPETLDQWLAQPQTFVKNTRMSFLGVKKPDDRRDVIAYVEIEQAR